MSGQFDFWHLVLACSIASSCAVGPDFKRPAPPAVDRYTSRPLAGSTASAAEKAQRLEYKDDLQVDWWRLLHCPALDAIIREALANNPGLMASEATLRKTQDALRAGYGIFFPQIDGKAAFTRQQFNPATIGLLQPASIFNLFSLGGTISYALDIWGGQRRTVEALGAQAEAQRYAVIGAYVMLEGNVVNTVVAAAAYRDEIRATEELAALEEDQVHLTDVQVRAGTAPYVNLLALQSQLAITRATIPPLAQKLDQAQHLVTALVGRTPGEWTAPTMELGDLSLPTDIPLSLPSQLVRQRPDILLAEEQLHAANAEVGVATAALLPNLTLSGSLSANNSSAIQIFSSSNLAWSVGAGLTQPLFHGGTLWYQRQEALDARDQAFASYRQSVITAFQQVADLLGGLEHDADEVAAQVVAVSATEAASRLVQANYEAGLASYVQLLTANAQLVQTRIGYIQAIAQRLQDTVALFIALGGGWWYQAGTERQQKPGR